METLNGSKLLENTSRSLTESCLTGGRVSEPRFFKSQLELSFLYFGLLSGNWFPLSWIKYDSY